MALTIEQLIAITRGTTAASPSTNPREQPLCDGRASALCDLRTQGPPNAGSPHKNPTKVWGLPRFYETTVIEEQLKITDQSRFLRSPATS